MISWNGIHDRVVGCMRVGAVVGVVVVVCWISANPSHKGPMHVRRCWGVVHACPGSVGVRGLHDNALRLFLRCLQLAVAPDTLYNVIDTSKLYVDHAKVKFKLQ